LFIETRKVIGIENDWVLIVEGGLVAENALTCLARRVERKEKRGDLRDAM
jgi:hypothetical protein